MTYEQPTLNGLIGQIVGVKIPMLNEETEVRAKIHAVEVSGLWIECKEITEIFLGSAGKRAAPTTMVFFVPFQQIQFVIATIGIPSISELNQ